MTSLELNERHVPRRITPLGRWDQGGWRIKAYGIAYAAPSPRPELVAAAKHLAWSTLPNDACGGQRYGVGFVGAHDARTGCYVFVDWWSHQNELHHHAFAGVTPDEIRPTHSGQSVACLWDLEVIDFERRAWFQTVLMNPDGADLDAYLDHNLDCLL